ncbi:hypothetical protein HY251_05535 [bacterium]|nr:hypothetical protein [bacterium]
MSGALVCLSFAQGTARAGALARPWRSSGSALVHEIAPEDDGPGSVITNYRGVQSVVVRRLMGYYRRIVADDFRERWRGTSLSLLQLEGLERRLEEKELELARGGNWGARTWRQSLVPEKGGAPVQLRIDTIGSEIELLRIGELAFTNEGKLRLGRLSVYLDDERTYEKLSKVREVATAPVPRARADAHLARAPGAAASDRAAPSPVNLSEENRFDLTLALDEEDAQLELERLTRGTLREGLRRVASGGRRGWTPRGNLWTGDGWNVTVRPTLRLRLPSFSALEETISNAAVEVNVLFFTRGAREPWGALSLRVHGRPSDNELVASVEFDFLRW